MPENLLDYITEEQQFVDSVKNGNKTAFGHLYDKYALTLFGIINGLTNHDTSLSEQILHDSFCAIWQNIKKHDGSKQRLFTWMICLTRNLAKETLQKKRAEIQKKGIFVDKTIEMQQTANKISKSALELVCFSGYTMKEAAKKLDICTKDLKIKLRHELNSHRQTSV